MSAAWFAAGLAGAAGAALCLWRMHRRLMPALRALDSRFDCPDMRFGYAPGELFDGLERLGAQGRALLMRFWLTDAGFIASLLAVMLAVARGNMAELAPLRMAMDAAACLRAAADLLENALLARVTRACPGRRLEGAARAASLVTQVKWCLTGLWVAGLFGGLLLRAAQL